MGSIRKALIVLAVFSLPALPAPPAFPALPALSANPVVKGPERGALVIVGGGKVGTEILSRMFDLAGGKDAPLVVIPTANGQDEYPADWPGLKMFRDFGATDITLLHTKDRKQADSEAFVRPLMAAKLVWFVGGRQWRLVDVYAHTRTQREIERVLERDGVVAGSSAGASILSSYLVRGARENNFVMMAPGYEEGFGLIKGVALDQHMLTRNRQDDLEEVVAAARVRRVRPECQRHATLQHHGQ